MTAVLKFPTTQRPLRQFTDLGNAERLVQAFGHDFRYVPTWKKWLVWDGTRWAIDRTGQLQRWAADVVIALYDEAGELPTKEERGELVKHAKKSEGEPRLKAMVTLASTLPGVPIMESELDRDAFLLTVPNGTIDLRTGELGDHDRAHLITKMGGVDYDKDAQCPGWIEFLSRIMAKRPDLIAFIQRASGYSLTGDTREQCLFFLYGSNGANGKSTLLEILRAAFREHAMSSSFDTFMQKRGDGPRTDLARLRGARLVTAVEADEGQRFAESVVKQVTGGDTIVARFLYAEEFEFRPTLKIWLAANHKPRVRGTDGAIWRRIRLIPFEITIPEEERDKTFSERLIRDELPGIFAWIVRGCLQWQVAGLGEPAEVREATAQYREEEDPLAGFLSECCELDRQAVVGAAVLFQAYRRYALENGVSPVLTQTPFGRKLSEKGVLSDKNGPAKTVRRVGIRLRADSSPPVAATVPEPSNTNGHNEMDSSGQLKHPLYMENNFLLREENSVSTVQTIQPQQQPPLTKNEPSQTVPDDEEVI